MQDSLWFAGLELDVAQRRLSVPGQYPVALGKQQSAVLGLLMRAGGSPVAPAEVERICGAGNARSVVAGLARRLRALGARVPITYRSGDGWCLADPRADRVLSYLDLTLYPTSRRLEIAGASQAFLGHQQAAILGLLMEARGGLLTAAQLDPVPGMSPPHVVVGNLAQRLRTLGTQVRIANVYGRGWQLVLAPAPQTLPALPHRSVRSG